MWVVQVKLEDGEDAQGAADELAEASGVTIFKVVKATDDLIIAHVWARTEEEAMSRVKKIINNQSIGTDAVIKVGWFRSGSDADHVIAKWVEKEIKKHKNDIDGIRSGKGKFLEGRKKKLSKMIEKEQNKESKPGVSSADTAKLKAMYKLRDLMDKDPEYVLGGEILQKIKTVKEILERWNSDPETALDTGLKEKTLGIGKSVENLKKTLEKALPAGEEAIR